MKKLYVIDFASEHYTPFVANELWNYLGEFKTRKEAHKRMVDLRRFFLKTFAKEIELEKKNGNTISIDLTKFELDDGFDLEKNRDVLWEQEHYLIDSRYLCGRY